MFSIHLGIFPNLLKIASKNKLYQTCPTNESLVLLSLCKLYDNDYLTIYDKRKCLICKDKPVLIAR